MASGIQDSVSPREAEVLALLSAHLSNAQIAARLGISVRTVENHVSSLLRKYGAADRRALAIAAMNLAPEVRAAQQRGAPAWHTTFVGRTHERDTVLAMLGSARLRRHTRRRAERLGRRLPGPRQRTAAPRHRQPGAVRRTVAAHRRAL